jgi:hypothetical protein
MLYAGRLLTEREGLKEEQVAGFTRHSSSTDLIRTDSGANGNAGEALLVL